MLVNALKHLGFQYRWAGLRGDAAQVSLRILYKPTLKPGGA